MRGDQHRSDIEDDQLEGIHQSKKLIGDETEKEMRKIHRRKRWWGQR